MKNVTENDLAAFISACHRIGRHGLITASAGNLSWRLDADFFLVSGSGSWLAGITPDQVALCRLEDGSPVGGAKPSMETGFHAGVLRERPDCRVVLHCQSVHATAVASAPPDDADAFNLIPELPFHVGRVAVIEYLEPGSAELARAVIAAMRQHNLCLLVNHGQVALGADFDEAVKRALFFEFVCELLCKSQGRARPMSRQDADRLQEKKRV